MFVRVSLHASNGGECQVTKRKEWRRKEKEQSHEVFECTSGSELGSL